MNIKSQWDKLHHPLSFHLQWVAIMFLSLSLSLSLIIVFAKYISSFLLHEDKLRKVSKKALSQTPKKARKH